MTSFGNQLHWIERFRVHLTQKLNAHDHLRKLQKYGLSMNSKEIRVKIREAFFI